MERDCQTIPTISDNGFEDNLANWEQLFQGAGRTTPPGGEMNEWRAAEQGAKGMGFWIAIARKGA